MRQLKLVLYLALALLFAKPSFADIALNGSGDLGNNGGSTSSKTAAYTVGSGAKRLLFISISGDLVGGADDLTSVTYAGATMTLIDKNAGSTNNRILYSLFLLNPTSGSNNFVITFGSTHYIIAVAADYTGVRQSSQPDNHTTNAVATGASLTTFLTTVADNCWTILAEESIAGAGGSGSHLVVPGGAFGEPSIYDSNGLIHPAGSYSMTTVTSTSSTGIAHNMASFAPDTGGGGVPTSNGFLGMKVIP